MVMPPSFCTAPNPSAPSSPMPVISTPTACVLNSSAALRKSTSALGRCPFTRGSSQSTTTSPRGSRFTFMWRLPGQISTRPGCNTSPDCASFTRKGQTSSNRRANMSVNPSGMCCTTVMVPGKSPGNCDNTYSNAWGPPVETPMATTLFGGADDTGCFSGLRGTPDRNGSGKVSGQLRQHIFQCLGTAGGDADGDHLVRRCGRYRLFFGLAGNSVQQARLQFALGRSLHLGNQFPGGFRHVGGGVFGLGYEVECTQPQRLHGDRGAFGAVGTEHDYRQRLPPHDFLQRFDSVHARHFQIQRDHAGLQLFDLFQAEGAIHRRSDDFDGFVGGQHLRNQLAHQRRIVDHEHAYRILLHAWPPTAGLKASRMRSVDVSNKPEFDCPVSCGRQRATCSTTAGRFRISTTRPSPRMEAPETRSVENVWSSSALITNSSSPSSASTIKPYFLSPAVMMSTKSLDFRSPSATGRPNRSSGSTWLRNCSTS